MSESLTTTLIELHHGGTRLALYPWRDADGPPLLLLHGLYENAHDLRHLSSHWPGPAFGLDLSGHGRSAWREGGVYSPELFAADADVALAEIGRESDKPVVLAGSGVGAYVSLLLAGGRPELVRAAVLAGGAGLEGGGPFPNPDEGIVDFDHSFLAPARIARKADRAGVDPRVAMAGSDQRPPDYAEQFARRAKRIVLVDSGSSVPPWWSTLTRHPNVETLSGTLEHVISEFTDDPEPA